MFKGKVENILRIWPQPCSSNNLFWCLCCRHTPAHAHSRAQRGRSSSAALRLRLHSSTRLRPAATAQLRLWHVNTHQLQRPPSRLNPTPSLHLSFSLCVPHQLPMVFYSQQGPQASNSPLSFWVLFFYYVVLLEEKTFNCIEGLLFVFFEKKLDHMFVCFSHSIFMTTYLELFLCWC